MDRNAEPSPGRHIASVSWGDHLAFGEGWAVINQNSSQCPSMWHQLWPMHRGTGDRQNYLTGEGLPPLEPHVCEKYAPLALFIARHWDARDAATEGRLTGIPGVSGLVFSTFRHDNPGAIARNDWRFR